LAAIQGNHSHHWVIGLAGTAEVTELEQNQSDRTSGFCVEVNSRHSGQSMMLPIAYLANTRRRMAD